VASAQTAGEALEKTLAVQETAALELSKLAIQYGVLSREVESDRALYESVLSRMKETSITKEVQPNRIRIQQAAFPPDKPSSPKKLMILVLAVLAGISSGLFLVVGLSSLDTSVRTVDEIEAMLRLPVLSAIPQIKEVQKGREIVVVAEDAKSGGAEAFRSLRASLSMLGRIEDRRTFLFTSAVPEEGKTFCSINFAASLAQLGLKTLLIDADLRRPAVEHNLTGSRNGSIGVTDYLIGQKKLDEIVQATKVANLCFLSGGTTAPNPAELLANTGLKDLLAEALQKYDRVVVDSAPIHAVSDTLLLVKNVQTVCLVVRAVSTPRRAITRCVQALVGAGTPLAGVVLNRMPRRRSLGHGYYYDYSYHGEYSKEGVYGSK
jgi:capsular exopolysaccharide synthesis family protein